jgi:hypothetical protein
MVACHAFNLRSADPVAERRFVKGIRSQFKARRRSSLVDVELSSDVIGSELLWGAVKTK